MPRPPAGAHFTTLLVMLMTLNHLQVPVAIISIVIVDVLKVLCHHQSTVQKFICWHHGACAGTVILLNDFFSLWHDLFV